MPVCIGRGCNDCRGRRRLHRSQPEGNPEDPHPTQESPFHGKGGTIGGRAHGVARLGGLEGFVKGFGAEGSAMVCATGGFIRFSFRSPVGNSREVKIRISTVVVYLPSDQNFPFSARFPSGIILQCVAANLAVAFARMSWRAEFA